MHREKVISLLPPKPSSFLGMVTHAFSFGTAISFTRLEVTLINGEMTCVQGETWVANVPVDPTLSIQILTRDLPVNKLKMSLLPAPGHIDVEISGNDFKDERRFTMSTSRTGSGNIVVSDEVQQRGIGRILMRNQIEFAHALGLGEFRVTAGSRAGGYAWARMGVTPIDMNTNYFNEDTRQRAIRRFEAVSPLMSPEEKTRAAPLLALRTPEDMRSLIDLDIDLSHRLKQAFSQAASFTPDEQMKDILYGVFNERAQAGKKITLGQTVMAGTCWDGKIELNNPVQMRRVGDYVGGWKYIGFK